MGNMARVRITVRGTRALLQHRFGPEAIPLEKAEKTGVAGNDPTEWKRTCMVTPEGQLYILPSYVFGCFRNGARNTKKGRGSIQPQVASTLQVEDDIVLLNRWMPEGDPPTIPTAPVFIDVCGVRNPQTKGRNVRYRLAASKGWECTFTIAWDRTVVSREQMRAVVNDASKLAGFGDGISIGYGRFDVIKWEELTDAEETATDGGVEKPAADRVAKGRKTVRALQTAASIDGMSH